MSVFQQKIADESAAFLRRQIESHEVAIQTITEAAADLRDNETLIEAILRKWPPSVPVQDMSRALARDTIRRIISSQP